MSLSRKSGRVKFIENGIKIVPDKFSDEMIEWMKNIPETVKKLNTSNLFLKIIHTLGNIIHIWVFL